MTEVMKVKKLTVFLIAVVCSFAASAVFSAPAVKAPAEKRWTQTARFGGADSVNRLVLDIRHPLDLRVESGISFDISSPDWSRFSRMLVYFKSGNGWYQGSFEIEGEEACQRITVYKRDITGMEGDPSGWGNVSVVRIAAYRAATAVGNAEISVSGLAYVSASAEVLLVASGKKDDSYLHYAATFSRTMDAAGIVHASVLDHELRADDLKGRKVAVLPYNGSFPEGKESMILDFIAGGGKVVACYTVPVKILSAIGIRRTGWFSAASGAEAPFTGFLRTESGLKGQPSFVPQVSGYAVIAEPAAEGEVVANWANADRGDSGKPAIVRTGKGVFISHVWAGGATPDKVALMQSVFQALHPDLSRVFKRRRDEIARLRRESEAELMAVARVAPGERFAVWCHTAYGPDTSWDKAVGVLAKAGCTDLIPNLCWGGHAYYRSSVLPVHKAVSARGDAYELVREACRKYGIRFHVWRVCGNLHGCPKEYRERLRSEKRLAVRFDGTEMDGWVCLSHPDNLETEIASLEELAAKGAPGVHLDYIRYRDRDTCFCDACRERFERFIGGKIDGWPRAVRTDRRLEAKWTEFRCGNIDKIVRDVYRRVKAKNPKCEVSAAVFHTWASAPDQVAQSAAKWCGEGILDFICPMDYTASTSFFANSVRDQMKLAGKVPMLPGIGLSCWRDNGDDAKLFARQISAARAEKAAGWTLFDLNERGYNAVKVMAKGK